MRARTIPLIAAIAALGLGGCGSTTVKTVTQPAPEGATSHSASSPSEQTRPASLTRAAHLAADHVRSGEIVIKQNGTGNRGPYTFRPGIYRVRFQQWDSSREIDFATEASSLVVQLDRRPDDITGETVTVFNVTKERGTNQITVPGGRFYVDISSEDYGVVLRFTPES